MPGLTDEQMAAMEAPQGPKKGLTDEEMAAHEAPQSYADKYNAKYGKPNIGASIENMAGARLLAPAASAMGRIGQNIGMSGARAAGDTEGSLVDKAKAGGLAAFLGGGLSAAGEGVSAAGNKLADYLMQKSVGMRKNTPGVGNRLVDQGVWGTQKGMANQMETKIPEAEEAVQGVVNGMEGSVPSASIADELSRKGQKFLNPDSGNPFPGKEASYGLVKDTAESVGGMGNLSPQALLKLKRASDYEGYTASGTPATSLKAELEQVQADKARGLLSEMSGGASKEALADEQALILANKALTKPETIHQGGGSSLFFGKVPGQSIGYSTAAHASQKVAGNADKLVDPRLLQSLFGK